jgi:hypothetical protein
MIDWSKLNFPNTNATASELYCVLKDFLQAGLESTDADEQRRRHLILKRVELNRHNWSAMAAVIQLEIARDAEVLSQLCWNIPLRETSRRIIDRRQFTRRRKSGS